MSKSNQVLTCEAYQLVRQVHLTCPFFQEGVWGNLAFHKKRGSPKFFASLPYGAVCLNRPAAPFCLPGYPPFI